MARAIAVFGHSDNLVVIETDSRPGEPREIGVYDEVCQVEVKDPATGLGLQVCAQFTRLGVWMVGIAQLGEGAPLPLGSEGWDVEWDLAEPSGFPDPEPYSVRALVTAPDSAVVTQLWPHPR